MFVKRVRLFINLEHIDDVVYVKMYLPQDKLSLNEDFTRWRQRQQFLIEKSKYILILSKLILIIIEISEFPLVISVEEFQTSMSTFFFRPARHAGSCQIVLQTRRRHYNSLDRPIESNA